MNNLKKDFKEVTADGKQEIVPGNEVLAKDPKDKKNIKKRWKNLKKGLNNLESIMDLKAESQDEPEEQDEPQEGEQVAPQIPEDEGDYRGVSE